MNAYLELCSAPEVHDRAAETVVWSIATQLAIPTVDVRPNHQLERDLALTSLDIVLIAQRFDIGRREFPVEALESVVTVADMIHVYAAWLAACRSLPPAAATTRRVEARPREVHRLRRKRPLLVTAAAVALAGSAALTTTTASAAETPPHPPQSWNEK